MRLWSFSPRYLDNVGLSRAINEGISGYKALTGKQTMWQNHSQLIRFKKVTEIGQYPHLALREYLIALFSERLHRWLIDLNVIDITNFDKPHMIVTKGQLIYEWKHYLNKLQKRNKKLYEELKGIEIPEQHPIFEVIDGDIESWEKVK